MATILTRGTFGAAIEASIDALLSQLFYGVFTVTDNLVAHAGGGQASATLLPSSVNAVRTVASPSDSVALPAASVGSLCIVLNATPNAMQVFAVNGTDTVGGAAGTVGVSQPGKSIVLYACVNAGAWGRKLGNVEV
jgi:hypothetical protein